MENSVEYADGQVVLDTGLSLVCRVDGIPVTGLTLHPDHQRRQPRAVRSAEETLGNVVWLINQFDDIGLGEVQDLPILEIARHLSISPRRDASKSLDEGQKVEFRDRQGPKSLRAADVVKTA